MRLSPTTLTIALVLFSFSSLSSGASVYLNDQNITVAVGSGTSPGNFHNTFDNGFGIEKVIDAPSATAEEFHNQITHIWFTADQAGGGLELEFDFGRPYDITTLHFWNYTGESYDVDSIDFDFFNSSGSHVGSLSIQPALGTSPGITAQDISLAAPLNVEFVRAFLTGSNREVDFQNIGFSANPSAVPLPPAAWLFISAVGGLALFRRKTQS